MGSVCSRGGSLWTSAIGDETTANTAAMPDLPAAFVRRPVMRAPVGTGRSSIEWLDLDFAVAGFSFDSASRLDAQSQIQRPKICPDRRYRDQVLAPV
jgi:hypothetical protein